jgi:acyl homoserine lactone synthase
MVRTLVRADHSRESELFDQMYRARAAVFHDRLRWNVRVRDGWEIDRYDEAEDPVYLVTVGPNGRLTGSLRLLPTTGATMLHDEFVGFFNEPVDVESPTTWECTRFCVHPAESEDERHTLRSVSSELMMGVCELGLSCGIEHVVGVYDSRMSRIYARIGYSPSPLAVSRPELGKLIVGIWDVSESALENMRLRAGLREIQMRAA